MAEHCGRNSCVHYAHAAPKYATDKCPIDGCSCALYVACDCGSVLYHDTSDASKLSSQNPPQFRSRNTQQKVG